MVKFELNISINEFIASTNSVVEVFLNNNFITSLNSKKSDYSNQLILSEQKNHLIIRRKYAVDNIQKIGLIKQMLSSLISLVLFSSAFIEPFECLCECQEDFDITFNKDTVKLEINCSQNADELYPSFQLLCKDCDISSQKTLFVSDEELDDTFNERRRMIKSWIFWSAIVFLIFIVISIIYVQTVTLIFSAVVFSLLLFCCFNSLKNLRKQCLAFKEKFNHRSL